MQLHVMQLCVTTSIIVYYQCVILLFMVICHLNAHSSRK